MPGSKKDGSKRTLVRWSDDLDKQLVLCMQYACNEAGLRIPWDNVAKLMGEKFSDGAIVQHLSKLRQKMIDNNLPVPPPLKRGTTVVPSKIYATSGGVRRKSMPETPTTTSTTVTTPKSKPSATKKRGRRSGIDSDSDSQPEDMDIADTSDEEYGASGRKKKKQQRQPKSKQAPKKTSQELKEDENEAVGEDEEDTVMKSPSVVGETTKESVETPGPASRTRGVRPDYSKLEQVSDDEENAGRDNVKHDNEGLKDEAEKGVNEEALVENETENLKPKSDGEVSPRSKVPASPATPSRVMNLPSNNNTPRSGSSVGMHTPYYGAPMQQYQSPQNTFPGMPVSNYLPHSRMTSFSTNRNDSISSLTSSMPPGLSTQSSFSHAPAVGQVSFANQPDLYHHVGVDFSNMGGGISHDIHQLGTMLPSDEDDEEFSHLFAQHGRS